MVLGHDISSSQRTQDIKITEKHTFDSMLLSQNTLRGLQSAGFYTPSPIQLHGIPWGKCGCDLLLEAKSGTGKTAVFAVIALEQLHLDKGVQTLILAPTREIASQICDVIKTIGLCYEGLSVAVVMGGLPYQEDIEKFEKKVHIVVGSPGRLRALILNKHIDVSSIRLMVLDEADKLVEKSYLSDINYIFSQLPNQKQVILSSATYPEKVRTDIYKYLQHPLHVCPDSNSILLGIDQQVTIVPNHINNVKQIKNKYEELIKILSRKQFKQCILFCNYTARVDEIYRKLNKDKWPSDKLSGKQDQIDRLEALKTLQTYNCRILVTTDLTARGIDAPNVDLVINFELPYDWQTYLHRIGRAGRYGSYGTAITVLCEGADVKRFKSILRSTNMLYDLKHVWNNEPFALNELSKEKTEEDKSQLVEIEKKLDIQESYEELWKMLSVDLTEPNSDIPSFKSLSDSFAETNKNSKYGVIENFQDLVSSFQNNEIKKNNHVDSTYKTIKVNNLIMPCMLKSQGKKEEQKMKFGNDCETSFKLENEGYISKLINVTTIDQYDESIAVNHVKKNDTNKSFIMDSKSENNTRKSEKTHTVSLDQASNMPELEDTNSVTEIWKPVEDLLPRDIREVCQSPDDGANEKALFAANLPLAFGKSMNATKTKFIKDQFSKTGKHVHKKNVKKAVFSKHKQKQNYAYESSQSDESENETDSTERSFKSKDIKSHSTHIKSNTMHGSHNIRSKYNNMQYNIEERQQEFDKWYQNIQAYSLMIEQSVYIAEMSKSYH